MTVRKKSPKKKASSPKKAGSQKAAPKKKAVAKKKAAPKQKAAAKKKTAPKKTASAEHATEAKKAPTSKPAAKTSAPKKSGASSLQVMMGHVFALKPRVTTGFRPDDFRRARQLLEDESYESIAEAARAVAEKALELTHDGPGKRRDRR